MVTVLVLLFSWKGLLPRRQSSWVLVSQGEPAPIGFPTTLEYHRRLCSLGGEHPARLTALALKVPVSNEKACDTDEAGLLFL
jgi:hypothetical protein